MNVLRFYLLLVFCFSSLYSLAQPANDNYGAAIDVTSLINTCSPAAAYTTTAATADLNKGSCWNTGAGPVANVWFRFTAPASGRINVTVDITGTQGTQRYTELALWQADGTTQVACNLYVNNTDDVVVGATTLTPGATYYVSVDVLNTGQRGTFTLCLNDAVDYDYYEGATDVTALINTCSADAIYSTTGATPDKNPGACWNNGGPLYNRWFKFTAPASGKINVTVDINGTKGTQRYTQLALWQADGTTPVACNLYVNNTDDVTVASTTLTPGASYYISVDVLNSGQRGTFTLCLSDAVDYDYYEGATDVTALINTCSADAIYSTTGATPDKNPGACWNNGGPLYNRWFKFTAPASGRINVTVDINGTKGTQRYTQLALWQADGTTPVACNLYVNNTDDVTVASTALTPGATYYISVDVLNSGQRGTFTLCLSDAVDYDYYEGATDVTALINACSADAIYSTTGATPDKNPGACWNNGGPLYNRWFKFTAPASGRINVTVDINGTKGTQRYTQLALWQADGTTPVACNLYVNNTDDVTVASTTLTPGATYYISVDVLNSGQRGTFTLCLSDAVDYDYYEGATDVTALINTCSADAIYSTTGATPDKNPGACWNNGGPLYNRWFTFTAPASGRINVTVDINGTKGTQRYTQLALWQADGTTPVACNLYVNNTDDVTVASTALTPGATYYISVDVLNSGQRGTFTLCLSDAVDYDYYEGATDVTALINTCSADAAYSTTGATPDKNPGACWNNGGPLYNRWFTFTAPASGRINVTVDINGTKGTQRYTQLALWQSDGTTPVACNLYVNNTDDVTVASTALTPGATYYISVDVLNSGQRGTFTLCLSDAVDYDYYEGATDVTSLINTCSADAIYSTMGATPDKNAGACWNNGGPLYNRWFKFTAPASGRINVTVDINGTKGTQRYTQLALWQANGTTQVACNLYVNNTDDVVAAATTLTPGATYYFSVDVLNSGQRGTFTLCLSDLADYDYYEGAFELTDLNNWCSSDAAYTTNGATADKNRGSCWNNGGPLFNRWFKFQAITANVTITVDIVGAKGSQRYTQLALWQTDGITQVACSRYSASTDDVSISNSSLVVGNWYYISVDVLNSGQRGTFTLCVNNIANTYYSRASGPWDNNSTWSTAGYGGSIASSYPNAGDVANIRGYDITVPGAQQAAEVFVDAATANTSLTVNTSSSLTVNGKMTLRNSGNNFTGALSFLSNSSAYINNNLIFDRQGGNANFGITISTGSTVTVNRDLQLSSSGGTVADNLFTMNGTAAVTVNQDVNFSSTSGRPLRLQVNNSSVLTVKRDVNFIASGAGLEVIELNNAAQLKIGRSFVRGSTPYGAMTSANTATVEYNGSVYPQVFAATAGSGGDSFSYGNVIINNTRAFTPQITMGGAATVNGNLTMTSGVVRTTSSNILTLMNASSTTIGSSSSYIDGPMRYEVATSTANTVRNFPIGKNGDYRPAVLTVSHTDASSVFYTAEHYNSSAVALGYTLPVSIDRVSGARYWNIDRPGAPANLSSATVRLYYGSGSSDGVTDFANLTVVKNVGSGTVWFDINGTATGNGTGSILSGSFSTFSNFTLGNKSGGTNPLPVTWKSFTGTLNNGTVNLKWVTASEKNNDHFEVQRSADGEVFEDLARIPTKSAGYSDFDLSYEFSDEDPLTNHNYYRIKQVDLDNSATFSKVIRVDNDAQSIRLGISVFPNPVENNTIFVKVKTTIPNEDMYITLYDMTGRLVFQNNFRDSNGKTIELKPEKLTKGIYLIKVRIGQMTDATKLMIVD